MATMSCATPTRRAARAINDGSFGPLLRHQEDGKREMTGELKSALPTASELGGHTTPDRVLRSN